MILRWIGRIAAALCALLVVGAAGGWLWLRSSLPRAEGTLALPGLEQPVEIRRDGRGVPHIRARTLHDAHFALGFVHAQDRLWQMDFNRRLGAGRLSEVLGAPTLETDRFMRTLGLYHLAQQSVARLSPGAREAVDAYTAGVNAFLDNEGGAWPPEFYLLRYRPEKWTAADSLVWGRMMAIFLSRNWREEALRARIRAKLGDRALQTLFPPYPADAPRTLAALRDAMPNPLAAGSASNAWAVSGRHTATGKPFLANDPHLRFRAPGIWYLARIEAPGWEAAGATVPGVPFLILGHNGHIAWGMTSAETDVQDIYVEKVDPGDPSRYRTPRGSAPFVKWTEIVRVRGAPDVDLTIRATRHGPVISDLSPALASLAPAGHVLALATPALREDDNGAEALHALNHARGWTEFRDALRHWHAPHINLLYADTGGNIGMLSPARIPVRRSGDGSLPVPGDEEGRDWAGFVPFDELPQVLNPPSGRIANANNPAPSAHYPHPLGGQRSPGYRARRIETLLAARPRHDMESMTAMQTDTVSLMARDLLVPLLAARPATEDAATVHALLRGWDGTMARTIPQPLIVLSWLRALNVRLFADELGELWDDYRGLRPLTVKSVLERDTAWCDDRTTQRVETCAEQVSASLADAIAALTERHGADPTRWQWGAEHIVRFDHPVLGRTPAVGPLFNIRLPAPGGPYTLYRGQIQVHAEEAPFASVHGAAFRAVYDLADLARSRFIVAPGQSGNWFSPHYGDLAELWRDGGTFALSGAQQSGDALTLQPRRDR